MATGSARVEIASSGEPTEEPEHGEFGEPNPKYRPGAAAVANKLKALQDNDPRTYIQSSVVLDPDDPIDSILIEMYYLNRKKRADYAKDGDPLSNFFRTAEIMRAKGNKDWDALTSVEYALAIKQARLEALAENGRMDNTQNESVEDTMKDDAVYSVLKLAVYRRLHGLSPAV